MANAYNAHAFAIDTSTNVAGLTALKGSPCETADSITIAGTGVVLTVESDLVCESITGAVHVESGVTLTVDPAATLGSALCTLSDVYPLAAVNEDPDGAIVKIILAASRAIRKDTGLTFGPVVTEERDVLVFDNPTAYPRELLELTSVKNRLGETVEAIATGTDDNGHVLWLELTERLTGPLTVDGTWGWDAIPDDIVVYAAQTAADWFKRDQTMTMNALGDFTGNMTRRTRLLPPYVAEGLAQYHKPRF